MNDRRLEEVLLNATAPPEQLLYDGWLLRLSKEHIKRASSVNPVFPSTIPVAEKVDSCERIYRERGLVPIFRITSLSAEPALDTELEGRGYRVFEPSLVQRAQLDRFDAEDEPPAGLCFRSMEIAPWVQMVGDLRGWAGPDVEAHTRRITSSVLRSECLSLMSGEAVASCGLVTIEGHHAGLFDIYTPPEFRGKRLATAVCSRLLAIGKREGATVGWLSVLAANAPALAVYDRLGFTTAYEYWYRVPPDYQPP